MMDIKLLALDMDGTTLKSDHRTLSGRNRAAIEAAIQKGVDVVIATGRTRVRIPEQMLAIGGLRYALTSNGAAVTDLTEDRVIYSNPLPKPVIQKLIDTFSDLRLYIEAYCRGYSYVDRSLAPLMAGFDISPDRKAMLTASERPIDGFNAFILREDVDVEKFNFPFIPREQLDEVWHRLRRIPEIMPTTSIKQNAEINYITSSKADGLLHLCEHLGLTAENVMAIGDAGNDLAMLRFAGIGDAMENAPDDVKAAANQVTGSNDLDGVAQAIEKFLL